MKSSMKTPPARAYIAAYHGNAIATATLSITAIARMLRRRNHNAGSINTNGTRPFANTASPNSTPLNAARRHETSGRNSNSIPAANVTESGRSVTAMWLYPSHPADVARIAAASSAVRAPNSRRNMAKKKTRNVTLSSATGRRGARSPSRPRREPAAVIQ